LFRNSSVCFGCFDIVSKRRNNPKYFGFGFTKQTETNPKQLLFWFVLVLTEIYFCLFRGHPSHSTQGPPSYRVWGGGEVASTHLCPTYNQMHAGFSFSYSPISVLLRQPLSIKKSYAGAVHALIFGCQLIFCFCWVFFVL